MEQDRRHRLIAALRVRPHQHALLGPLLGDHHHRSVMTGRRRWAAQPVVDDPDLSHALAIIIPRLWQPWRDGRAQARGRVGGRSASRSSLLVARRERRPGLGRVVDPRGRSRRGSSTSRPRRSTTCSPASPRSFPVGEPGVPARRCSARCSVRCTLAGVVAAVRALVPEASRPPALVGAPARAIAPPFRDAAVADAGVLAACGTVWALAFALEHARAAGSPAPALRVRGAALVVGSAPWLGVALDDPRSRVLARRAIQLLARRSARSASLVIALWWFDALGALPGFHAISPPRSRIDHAGRRDRRRRGPARPRLRRADRDCRRARSLARDRRDRRAPRDRRRRAPAARCSPCSRSRPRSCPPRSSRCARRRARREAPRVAVGRLRHPARRRRARHRRGVRHRAIRARPAHARRAISTDDSRPAPACSSRRAHRRGSRSQYERDDRGRAPGSRARAAAAAAAGRRDRRGRAARATDRRRGCRRVRSPRSSSARSRAAAASSSLGDIPDRGRCRSCRPRHYATATGAEQARRCSQSSARGSKPRTAGSIAAARARRSRPTRVRRRRSRGARRDHRRRRDAPALFGFLPLGAMPRGPWLLELFGDDLAWVAGIPQPAAAGRRADAAPTARAVARDHRGQGEARRSRDRRAGPTAVVATKTLFVANR